MPSPSKKSKKEEVVEVVEVVEEQEDDFSSPFDEFTDAIAEIDVCCSAFPPYSPL
jgi:hypothetical protein